MENQITVTQSELSKSENPVLNLSQLKFITAKTPAKFVKKRPGKGGGQWDFVSGSYIKKVLNLAFGWDWDFQVLDHKFDLAIGQAFVLGRLTVRSGNRTIIKEQFGRVEIKMKKADNLPLDIGNDLKAAATDALKKCASELGIASDIYSKEDFKEVEIIDDSNNENLRLEIIYFLTKDLVITEEDRMNAERIIDQKETESYGKLLKFLKSKQ